MSVNKYQPHVLVLPEDDANRQMAIGFVLELSVRHRNVQVLPVAGGWTHVRDEFVSNLQQRLLRWPAAHAVLLVDFDNRVDGDGRLVRREQVIPEVDTTLLQRVFVLGASGEPEALKKALGGYEKIGKALGKECHDETRVTWAHPMLKHNGPELDRMIPVIRPILFG
jgi:hypothetical protein